MPEWALTNSPWWKRAMLLGGVAAAVVATFAVVGCGGGDDDGLVPTAIPTTAGSATSPALSGEITVLAASSLTDAFKEAGAAFEEKYPGTKVMFSFAASSALAVQINELAPADVFASADTAQMKVVTDKQNALEPAIFLKNTPVVVVPKDGKVVATFADLAKTGIRLVLAGPGVPIGRYAREIFTKASAMPGGVSADFSDRALANLKSDESNVRAVLTKVQLGEADAGVVYRTDVRAAANDVKVVDIPAAYNVVAEYAIAVVAHAKNPATAAGFVAFVRSAEGQAIMEKFGFAKP